MDKRIMLSTPTMHGEELSYIQEAFDKNWIAPLGFNCDNFEMEISEYLCSGISERYHSLALSSGTCSEARRRQERR